MILNTIDDTISLMNFMFYFIEKDHFLVHSFKGNLKAVALWTKTSISIRIRNVSVSRLH